MAGGPVLPVGCGIFVQSGDTCCGGGILAAGPGFIEGSGELLLTVVGLLLAAAALAGVIPERGAESLVGVRLTAAEAEAWALFRDAAALPLKGRSLRDWKLRGLRPRTMTGADWISETGILAPVDKVATTLRRTTKCCCNSFLRPLLAVATRNWSRFHAMGKVA